MGLAEEMGRTLQRTSISVNIKERLDFSCALFAPDGGLVANAPHLPVHLGAMSDAVRAQVSALCPPPLPGAPPTPARWCRAPALVLPSVIPAMQLLNMVGTASMLSIVVNSCPRVKRFDDPLPGSPHPLTSQLHKPLLMYRCWCMSGKQLSKSERR